ncbi:MAG: hypothetical protein ACYCOU_04635 [Sulfobacillus sp.]
MAYTQKSAQSFRLVRVARFVCLITVIILPCSASRVLAQQYVTGLDTSGQLAVVPAINTVESVENDRTVFRPSHKTLKIDGTDFHIPTATTTTS